MISIVIPAYNEEKRLSISLNKILEFINANRDNYEIIVVDDGSNDRTASLPAEIDIFIKVIKMEKNSGKGASVRRGMLAAQGDYILFTDADLSTPIYELNKLLPQLKNGYDIAIGSRALDYSKIKVHQPFYREFMGRTFNKIVQYLVIKGIKDTQCGFKLFKKDAAKTIFQLALIDGFGFDVELLFLANKMGYKIKEVPVDWFNNDQSKVNPIKDSLQMLLEISRIKKLHKDLKK